MEKKSKKKKEEEKEGLIICDSGNNCYNTKLTLPEPPIGYFIKCKDSHCFLEKICSK